MSETMTVERVAKIRAMADACFRPPWTAQTFAVECDGEGCTRCLVDGVDGGEDPADEHEVERVEAPEEYPRDPEYPQVICDVYGLECFAKPHSVFMAAARQDVPDLCDALEAAWRRIAELEGRTP